MTVKFLSCIDLKEFISIFHFYNELATNPANPSEQISNLDHNARFND